MVAPERKESQIDRVLSDRLAAELKRLIGGRSIEESIALVAFVNFMLSQVEAADDPR